MAYSTISKPSLHFNTKLYTGNGGTQSITGVGFQPDWTWIKGRSFSDNHVLTDAVRGVTKTIFSDLTAVEETQTGGLTAFGSDGFSVGSLAEVNTNNATIASWNWKAGTGQGSSNTAGSINTTYTSVNTTAGFSISKFTATGSNATVGHGLGVAPAMVILKNLDSARSWAVGHNGLTNWNYHCYLNATNAENSDSTMFQGTAPSSTVFSVGTASETNESGDNFIAYCFAEKTGYSKFGSYEGNGNADGTFVYLGFKPAWLMVKPIDAADNWVMFDNKRLGFNSSTSPFNFAGANNSNAETTDTGQLDLLSNGFKIRNSGNTVNRTSTFIYMAFAEAPLVANVGASIPATAR